MFVYEDKNLNIDNTVPLYGIIIKSTVDENDPEKTIDNPTIPLEDGDTCGVIFVDTSSPDAFFVTYLDNYVLSHFTEEQLSSIPDEYRYAFNPRIYANSGIAFCQVDEGVFEYVKGLFLTPCFPGLTQEVESMIGFPDVANGYINAQPGQACTVLVEAVSSDGENFEYITPELMNVTISDPDTIPGPKCYNGNPFDGGELISKGEVVTDDDPHLNTTIYTPLYADTQVISATLNDSDALSNIYVDALLDGYGRVGMELKNETQSGHYSANITLGAGKKALNFTYNFELSRED